MTHDRAPRRKVACSGHAGWESSHRLFTARRPVPSRVRSVRGSARVDPEFDLRIGLTDYGRTSGEARRL